MQRNLHRVEEEGICVGLTEVLYDKKTRKYLSALKYVFKIADFSNEYTKYSTLKKYRYYKLIVNEPPFHVPAINVND